MQLKCSLSLLSQCSECSLVVYSQVSQHLAVQVDTSLLQTVHETAVVDIAGLASCRDAGDPQTTEVTLLVLTADVSVLQALHYSLVGYTVVGRLGTPVTLSTLQDLLSSFTVIIAPLTLAIVFASYMKDVVF